MRLGRAFGQVNLAGYSSPHATPDLDPLPALVKLIDGAKFVIYMSAYSFTCPDISAALVRAFKRGITIIIVGDFTESKQTNAQWSVLLAAGITAIRLWGTQYEINHDKMIIVDCDTINSGCAIASGSYNYTTSAEKSNKECMTIVSGIQVSRGAGPLYRDAILSVYALGKPAA